MTQLNCNEISVLMARPMSDAQAVSVEEHVEFCETCQMKYLQAEFHLKEFDERLRIENVSIALSGTRLVEIQAAARDATNKPLHLHYLPLRTTGFAYVTASLAACLLLAFGWWQFSGPTNASVGQAEQTGNPSRHPSVRDNIGAVKTKNQPSPPAASESIVDAKTEPAVTLFVRDRFMVADRETDDGEIPFFWVLPNSRQSVH